MLQLDNVTICIVDCINILRARVAIRNSIQHIQFKRNIILSNIKQKVPEAEVIEIHPIRSKKAYSFFILNHLKNYINTDFVLLVQWDGYVINPPAWTNKFFGFDYIGAPWVINNYVVGNGGCSLRSKKLLELTAQLNFKKFHPEDNVICIWNRDLLMNRGIKFAPRNIAARFSIENEPYDGSFCWHGGNLPDGFELWKEKELGVI